MNKWKVGAAYEKKAGLFLQSQGLMLLCYNFRSRCGEIDIVAKDKETLVFVEVKYRRNKTCGMPQEAVDYRKQYRICRAADYYLMLYGMGELLSARFDVVAVCGEEVSWFQNAFDYRERS